MSTFSCSWWRIWSKLFWSCTIVFSTFSSSWRRHTASSWGKKFAFDAHKLWNKWFYYINWVDNFIDVPYLRDIFLNGSVIICINRIQIMWVVDVIPHVVLLFDMFLKPLSKKGYISVTWNLETLLKHTPALRSNSWLAMSQMKHLDFTSFSIQYCIVHNEEK